MDDPRAVVPASIMPAYPWLAAQAADDGSVQARLRALRTLGHPYSDEQIDAAPAALEGKTELDALVAYLQSLGSGFDPSAEQAPDSHEGH
jgi:cytochrome c oxidase cbb3-type subunit 2